MSYPAWDSGRPSPVVLRLLPFVHHPPARVLVACAGGPSREAVALEARGYRVVERSDGLEAAEEGAFDLICEAGFLSTVAPEARIRYATAAARALRTGGKLFGAFLQVDEPGRDAPPWGIGASELIALLSASFDVERLEPSDFRAGPATQFEAIFVRR